jgi:3-dehydroquinate synthase
MELVTPPIIVPGGEGVKNDLSHLAELQKIVFDHHIDRHSFIIAVGGGAMLDAAGFVAATAHRGVRLVRVPTTLLGQCDSGVGVKNAVNLFGSKNYWGSFAPPFAVLNDAAFLRSLPVRERIAGMAEAVKVALIRDAHFFRWIEENTVALARGDEATVGWLIRRCAELHMHQIAHGGDPFEMGSARPLDFGHWAAHRLETQTEHKLRHGEAVAIGIALDTRYSVTAGLLPAGEELRVALLLERLGFRLWQEALQERAGGPAGPLSVIEGLREFREHLGGDLTITLIAGIGQGIEVHSMDETQIEAAINWLQARDATR